MRLARSAEFLAVKQGGRVHHGPLFTISILRRSDEDPARFGIITSKRVGNAVARSRARRILREVIRRSAPSLSRGYWIVLIARKALATSALDDVRQEWLRLGKRASIFEQGKDLKQD
jgi:ribonuclease P protein component